MFQRKNNTLKYFYLPFLIMTAWLGYRAVVISPNFIDSKKISAKHKLLDHDETYLMSYDESGINNTRNPANASSNFSKEQILKAEWAVSPQDFENSDPRGRSYFDYVFSHVEGDKRVYDIPFPFQKALEKVNQYLGYKSYDESLLMTLFPMGRSLQRNAALLNAPNPNDANLFFRFPRVVVAVGQEPLKPNVLNLKGRLYLGFNEKSKVIEVISYNDDEGRFEYQIVRDYEQGKKPHVTYANRLLCLSCHQNQTPIFSRGPWNESNAHADVFTKLDFQFTNAFGTPKTCSGSEIFCSDKVSNQNINRYFGVPTKIDQTVTFKFDTLTDNENYSHAYQKMWLSLCDDINCKYHLVNALFKYLLTGQEGVYASLEHKQLLAGFEARYNKRFPNGLKIPNPDIPNRNPLVDKTLSQVEIELQGSKIDNKIQGSLQKIIKNTNVPGEFEPLQPREPIEVWTSAQTDARFTNKLIQGLTGFFTKADILHLDQVLQSYNQNGSTVSSVKKAKCEVKKDASYITLRCPFNDTNEVLIPAAVFMLSGTQVSNSNIESIVVKNNNCDLKVTRTPANRLTATSCQSVNKLISNAKIEGDYLIFQPIKSDKLSARFLTGESVGETRVNMLTGDLELKLYQDFELISQALTRAINDPEKKLTNTPFSKKQFLSMIYKQLKVNFPDQEEKINTLEKNLDVEQVSSESIISQFANPIDAMTHSCGMCHYNHEGVPPAFLGLKQNTVTKVDKCRLIESCAARMLYRIKMRNCSESVISEAQKNPMPLPVFFKKTKVDTNQWQKIVAPQITSFLTTIMDQQKVIAHLISNGVAQDLAHKAVQELATQSCPNVDYSIYESLPRCDFSEINQTSKCLSMQNIHK